MGDSLAQLYSLTFFNVLIPGAASRVNLAVSDRPGSLWIDGRCRVWVKLRSRVAFGESPLISQ